jgi:hypothetical protein
MRESDSVEKRLNVRTIERLQARPQPSEALELRAWYAERPWWAVGAATGAGLLLGAQGRRLAESRLVGTLVATLGGVAMRLVSDAFQRWLEARRER